MVKVSIKTPIRAEILSASQEELDLMEKELSYTNTSLYFRYSKLLKNKWARDRDPVKWSAELNDLKGKMKRCLMWKEGSKTLIYPGSINYIKKVDIEAKSEIDYPKLDPMSFKNPIKFDLYPYQKTSIERLVETKHAAVELCTGAGKSAVITSICARIGAGTLIIVPYQSLFEDMVKNLSHHFGEKNVGVLGDGEKVLGRPLTVCISKSLSSLKPGTDDYEIIANSKAFMMDESQFVGAATLEDVCHGILKDIPYRLFLSGTQLRGDGSIKLLRSIIGPIVETLTTKEAIRGGYICDHDFRIKDIPSPNPKYKIKDPLKMKRYHFLYNQNIAQFIANLANATASVKGESTLVLVEELEQISALIPLLKCKFAYAHSSSNKKELERLGMKKVDSGESIEAFNRGEVKVLIGTSCISTGTNIYPTFNTVNWVGGSSEVKTKQGSVGRSVRKLENSDYKTYHNPKPKSIIWDFNVKGVEIMENHLVERVEFYKDSGTEIKYIK